LVKLFDNLIWLFKSCQLKYIQNTLTINFYNPVKLEFWQYWMFANHFVNKNSSNFNEKKILLKYFLRRWMFADKIITLYIQWYCNYANNPIVPWFSLRSTVIYYAIYTIYVVLKAHTKHSSAVTKENRIEYSFLFNLIRIHPIRILPTSKRKFSIKRNQYPMPLTALLSPRRSPL